jgi:hypothetical protein
MRAVLLKFPMVGCGLWWTGLANSAPCPAHFRKDYAPEVAAVGTAPVRHGHMIGESEGMVDRVPEE